MDAWIRVNPPKPPRAAATMPVFKRTETRESRGGCLTGQASRATKSLVSLALLLSPCTMDMGVPHGYLLHQ